jgi:hypothetical protein
MAARRAVAGHGLLGGNQHQHVGLNGKPPGVDVPVLRDDTSGGLKIPPLQRVHRFGDGSFHHAAQDEQFILQALQFPVKCLSGHCSLLIPLLPTSYSLLPAYPARPVM